MMRTVVHVLFFIAASLPSKKGFVAGSSHNIESLLGDLEGSLFNLETDLTAEKREFEAAEAQLTEQVSQLTKQIQDQEQDLSKLEDEDLHLVKEIERLEAELALQKRDHGVKVDEQSNDYKANDGEFQEHDRSRPFNQTIGPRGVRGINDDDVTCAFSMANYEDDTLSKNEVVFFRYEFTNYGNHYDPRTGVFTAPVDGLYVFHLIISSWGPNDGASVYLEFKAKVTTFNLYTFASDGSYPDTGPASCVVYLTKQDEVRPRLGFYRGHNHLLGMHSMFTGYLLQQS